MQIETTTALVQDILTTNIASRNSDNYLFYLVCKHQLDEQGIDVDKIGFKKLFLSLKEYGLPQFETVRRTRQKLQEENPELRCKESVAIERAALEETFRDFALEGKEEYCESW